MNCQCPQNVSALTSFEAGTRGEQTPQRKFVVDYTAPLTARLLFEAGMVRQYGVSDTHEMIGFNPEMISVVEQSNGRRYRAAAQYRDNFNLSWHARAASRTSRARTRTKPAGTSTGARTPPIRFRRSR